MPDLTVVVLAAGGGTRMKSKTMKVLHPIAGRSMIGHVLAAARATEPQRLVAVVGRAARRGKPGRLAGRGAPRRAGAPGHARGLPPRAGPAVKEQRLGPGDA